MDLISLYANIIDISILVFFLVWHIMSTWVWWTPCSYCNANIHVTPLCAHSMGSLDSPQSILWSPGPDSRKDPLVISSDTILWSWSVDRIPQTPITIGSSDRENTKPNSLLPIESLHKSFTGKFRIEITWSWLNKNVRLIISIHGVTMGGLATSFMSTDTRASWSVQCTHTVFAHDIQHGLDMP